MSQWTIYAGIGSRQTPCVVMSLMTRLAALLEKADWKLRSGGASGADAAFEKGVKSFANKAIYLPGPTFNGRRAGHGGCHDATTLPGWLKAVATVDQYHPDPRKLSIMGRKLMARNAMQVLGPNLDRPADYVICWTPDGLMTGGTAQALRIAKDHGIPVLNLGGGEGLDTLNHWLNDLRQEAATRAAQRASQQP